MTTVTLDIVSLEGILAELERAHDRCNKRLLQSKEAVEALDSLDRRTRELLPINSDAFRVYDRMVREHGTWWKETPSGYVDPTDFTNIAQWISALREALATVTPEFLRSTAANQSQFYFQAGEEFRARQAFYHLLKRATSSLEIIDQYLDPDVFDYLQHIDSLIVIRLITGTPKPLFVKQFHSLQSIRQKLEARSSHQAHDRFLIIDGQDAWHLGASINGLGKRACMINRIEDAAERSKLLNEAVSKLQKCQEKSDFHG